METWYKHPECVESMAMAINRREVVGIAMIIDHYDRGYRGDVNIGVYVKYHYRRQGIGRTLAHRVKKRTGLEIVAATHDNASIALYDSLQVETNVRK